MPPTRLAAPSPVRRTKRSVGLSASRGPKLAQAGLDGSCGLCVQALDLFVSLYGAQAGNVALTLMATAGVYVGGGIAPKIRAALTTGRFMEAFTAKGRFADRLRAIPVRVILDPHAAVAGAARYAAVAAGLTAA